MIGAVVLAAGQSKRMGYPKMTLPWGKTTVIGTVINVLLEAGIDDVVVVTGGAQEEVRDAIRSFPIRTVFNPDYENGEMLMTLRVGLYALQKKVKATLVVLGDQPQIQLSAVRSVVAAYKQTGSAIVVPSYEKRRGHPWLVTRRFWGDLIDSQPQITMRQFLNQHANEIHYLNLDTPSILQDLDTPEDYQRYQSL